MHRVRVIFHVDLNQFFCAIAILKNPSLKGVAFAIGRENTYKGVISTASYEARKYGIKAGMSQLDALKKYKKLKIVSVPYDEIEVYSKNFFNHLKKYSKKILQTSIDEGYIDVTEETLDNNIDPRDYAKKIQTTLLNELKLECSIGIAPTLYLAKMASDLKKPLGISVLRKRDAIAILGSKPVSAIYGIGKKTSERLNFLNILTINDFLDENNIKKITHIMSVEAYQNFVLALEGKTSNDVKEREAKSKSISHSHTYDNPLINFNVILEQLFYLTNSLIQELNKIEHKVKTITITLRDVNFKTITRGISIEYTNDEVLIKNTIKNLLNENYKDEKLRLVGVTFGNIKPINEVLKITLFNVDEIYK